MSMKQLSEMANVINTLKTLYSNSGYRRFSKEKMAEMGTLITKLEDQFITGVLADAKNEVVEASINIGKRVQEAKEKLKTEGTKAAQKVSKFVGVKATSAEVKEAVEPPPAKTEVVQEEGLFAVKVADSEPSLEETKPGAKKTVAKK